MAIVKHKFIESWSGTTGSGESALSGEDIVFLSHQRWNTHVTAVHNTVIRLARNNRVLFVEPPDAMSWVLHEPAAREALKWTLNPIEKKSDSLWVYHTPPLFLPGQAYSHLIERSVSATYEFMVRRAISILEFDRPIFWIYQFNTVWLLDALHARFVVYECAEEWADNDSSPVSQKYIRRVDAQMCRRADVVIVPSQPLFDSKRPYNPNTHRVPWGVDLQLYSRARLPDLPIPDDMTQLPRPIIGIVGMYDGRRLHVELLCTLARRHPDWSIVLVGRCMPNLDTGPLREVPNIHLFGMRPVDDLPAYCKSFNVCMLPYKIVDFTRSILPLKLIEYLPTGKPVVTTALPAAYEFRDVYYIAETIDDFERMVIQALSEEPAFAERRIARGLEYNWDDLVEKRMRIAADQLAKV